MSGLMAKFFANFIPFFAFLWSLSLLLFYRTLYIELAGEDAKKPRKTIVPLVICCFASFLMLFPVRTIINKCFENNGEEKSKITYSDKFMTFPTDYDRENPVTKNDGFIRVLDHRIKQEQSEAAKQKLE